MVGADNLLQDVASALGPDEWLGVAVVVGDVGVDGSDQFRHAGEHPAAQAVLGEVAEESLDHVQP